MTEGSDLIRYELENQALYVLDGNAQEDWIERIDPLDSVRHDQ